MIACTSISPTHVNKDVQQKAVQSWIDLGFTVYSFNHESEIQELQIAYPKVKFIPTVRTMEHTYGKKLVAINAVLDWCKENTESHFCIINSDIELKTDIGTVARIRDTMKTNIVLANRVNYETDYNGKEYLYGIDVFFIHKKFLSLFPQSMHCFGMTFWDYFIPFVATKKGVEVLFLKQNIAYHKNHAQQYNQDDWAKSGRFFLWENGLYQFKDTHDIGKMSTYVYNYIYNTCKRVQI